MVSAEYIKILQELNHDVIVFCDKRYNERELEEIRKTWGVGRFKVVYVRKLGNVNLNSILFNFLLFKHKIEAYFSVGWLILSRFHSKRVPQYRYALAPHTPFMYKSFRMMIKKSSMFYYLFRIVELVFNLILDVPAKNSLRKFTLSKFIKSMYLEFYGVNYDVLYPPVMVDDLHAKNDKVENLIVALGRITSEKNYGMIVNLARKYPENDFLIMGGYDGSKKDAGVMKLLLKAAKALPNLEIKINKSRAVIIEHLSRARYFLHLMRTEHFGIVIVEALKSGMTPIVPMNSGPDEIIGRGEYGHRYPNFTALLNDFSGYLKPLPIKKQQERAELFSVDKFRKKARISVKAFLKVARARRGTPVWSGRGA
ncbi:MAG: glycosyltransferase [Promethearchaeota archaeon]